MKKLKPMGRRSSKLDRPHLKRLIAFRLAQGNAQQTIADELGVTQPSISRIASRDDVKALRRKEENRLDALTADLMEKILRDPVFMLRLQTDLEKVLMAGILGYRSR